MLIDKNCCCVAGNCRIEPVPGGTMEQFSTYDGSGGDTTVLNSRWAVDRGHAAPLHRGGGEAVLRIYGDLGETIVRSTTALKRQQNKFGLTIDQLINDSIRLYINPRKLGHGTNNFADADSWTMFQLFGDDTDDGMGFVHPYMQVSEVTDSGATVTKLRKKLGKQSYPGNYSGWGIELSLCRTYLLCKADPLGGITRPDQTHMHVPGMAYLSGTWGVGGVAAGDHLDILSENVYARNTARDSVDTECLPSVSCPGALFERPSEIDYTVKGFTANPSPPPGSNDCDCDKNNVSFSCAWTSLCEYSGITETDPNCFDEHGNPVCGADLTGQVSLDSAVGVGIIGAIAPGCGIIGLGVRYADPSDQSPDHTNFYTPEDITGKQLRNYAFTGAGECDWPDTSDNLLIDAILFEPSD